MPEKLLDYLEGFITPERKERINEILLRRTYHIAVCIEDVYQMHNTSAVIRSCDVFGIQQLHVIEEQFGKRLDKNIAMGAEKWVDVHRYETAENCIALLKSEGYKIIATTPHQTSFPLKDFNISEKSVICFGTEKSGLSPVIMDQADGFIHIPMQGFAESLNISVSAAIVLHELRSRLNQSKISWQLSKKEFEAKRIDWTMKSIRSIDDIMRRFNSDN
ncbi:TrmH family RNA methyltransferase [Galbibacter sp.]|jgi:tRNA (guanosine-2'-O-)-methyltransferase|uniref:TrmH family RNA methyltransferase n=1 Tax=Galbibacter sp. TaxID=2918471 RepID=UPI003A8EF4BB